MFRTHAAREQAASHPAIEGLELGAESVTESRKQHDWASDLVDRLLAGEGGAELFEDLRNTLEFHFSEEEEEYLPQLRRSLAADDLAALGRALRGAGDGEP